MLLVLVLAACATPYTLVEPVRQTAGGLSVEPGLRWNALGHSPWEGRVAVWTLDGPALNTLLIVGGTADGEPIFTRKSAIGATAARQEAPPVFRRSMNSLEIAELFQATIARNYQTTLAEVSGVKPSSLRASLGKPDSASTPGSRVAMKWSATARSLARFGMASSTPSGSRARGFTITAATCPSSRGSASRRAWPPARDGQLDRNASCYRSFSFPTPSKVRT